MAYVACSCVCLHAFVCSVRLYRWVLVCVVCSCGCVCMLVCVAFICIGGCFMCSCGCACACLCVCEWSLLPKGNICTFQMKSVRGRSIAKSESYSAKPIREGRRVAGKSSAYFRIILKPNLSSRCCPWAMQRSCT